MTPERRAETRRNLREMGPGFLLGLPVWCLVGAWLLQSPWGVLGLIALLGLGPLVAALLFVREWGQGPMPPIRGWTAALIAPYLALPVVLFGPLVLVLWLFRPRRVQG